MPASKPDANNRFIDRVDFFKIRTAVAILKYELLTTERSIGKAEFKLHKVDLTATRIEQMRAFYEGVR